MTASSKDATARGDTLFNLALPGLEQAEGYYGKLASGDPAALARANAPAIGAITKATDSAKKNIVQDQPRGGERNLALEEADISKGAQVGNLETGSYTSSFGSLAGLGGQNVSQGNQSTATGLSGMNSAANQYGQMQQVNAESKSSTLGFLGSLAGAGGEALGMCWIAGFLYGEGSYAQTVIRSYFNLVLKDHWLGRYAYQAYARYGERWARYLPAHRVWRWVTKVVFYQIFLRSQAFEKASALCL